MFSRALIALSTASFALAAQLASGSYRIYSVADDGWVKNFPPGGSRPPFYTSAVVDNNFASVYERWEVDPFEEGFRIKNVGTGFWLSGRDGEVLGASEFSRDSAKWYIQSAGAGTFKVTVPSQDSVWTNDKREPDYPNTIFLRNADGSAAQLWKFDRIDQ